MWSIFSRHYDDVSRDRFDSDLEGKDAVILLVDETSRVRGFSTAQRLKLEVDGAPVQAVFSGDTVVEPEFRGQTALQVGFVRFALMTKLRAPHLPLYWFLISKGYKTYLLLARNVPQYWPRRDTDDIPDKEQRILMALAEKKFGASFKRDLGVVQFDECLGRVACELSKVDDQALRDPDVAFFASRNPGHVAGEELCCLAKLDLAFLLHWTRRVLRKTVTRRWQGVKQFV